MMSSKPTNEALPQSFPKDKNTAVKTLVRNCRSTPAVPVTTSQKHDLRKQDPAVIRPSTSDIKASEKEINLKEPQLHTSQKMKENLKKMRAGMKSVRFEQKVSTEPFSKASKKVNIRFDEKIYKDLIDLKVSEDDLGLRPISSGKTKQLPSSRDPVPHLSDFYKPSFDKEYVVKPHPPTFKIRKPERPANCPSPVLEAVKRWSVDDNKL